MSILTVVIAKGIIFVNIINFKNTINMENINIMFIKKIIL